MDALTISHLILAAIFAAVAYGAIKAFWGGFVGGDKLFCTTCGHEGETRTLTRGSLAVEIVLWLCLIVPGLIYSVWRLSSRTEACASCGGTSLVPVASPVAVKMRRDLASPPPAKP